MSISAHFLDVFSNGGEDSAFEYAYSPTSTGLDLDLRLGQTSYRRASVIDLYQHNFVLTDGRRDRV